MPFHHQTGWPCWKAKTFFVYFYYRKNFIWWQQTICQSHWVTSFKVNLVYTFHLNAIKVIQSKRSEDAVFKHVQQNEWVNKLKWTNVVFIGRASIIPCRASGHLKELWKAAYTNTEKSLPPPPIRLPKLVSGSVLVAVNCAFP